VQRQIGHPIIQILTTRKMCDCGTSLASARQATPSAEPSEHDLAKLRMKGWSESRIRRWLEEKATAARRQAAQEQLGVNTGAETKRWVRAIGQILNSHASEWVGVLVHIYSRGLDSERIALGPPNKVRLGALNEETLVEMNEDAMLIVHV
jgi:hypothetical protein